MNTKYLIAICAVFALLVSGLATAEAVDAETSASESEDSPVVKFVVDGKPYWKNVEKVGDNLRLPTLEAVGCNPMGLDFKGWFAGDAVDPSTSPCYPAGTVVAVPEPLVFTANAAKITYEVTFGDEVVSGNYGDLKDVPAAAEKKGFVFDSWVDSTGTPLAVEDGKFTIIGDAAFTAKYLQDPVVTFVIDGIKVYENNLTDVVYPDDPLKDNFTFLGWSVDGDTVALPAALGDGAAAVLAGLGLVEDTVFSALFEPTLHTVVFVVDGAVVNTQTVRHGELAVEPALVPVKDGFDFAGWDFDFRTPVVADTEIAAEFTVTVPPEPTGLDDPMTLTLAIIGLIIASAFVAVFAVQVKKGKIVIRRGKKDEENDRP